MKETSRILAGFGSFLATLAAFFVWIVFVVYPVSWLAIDMQMNTFSMILFWSVILFSMVVLLGFPSFYYKFLKVELYKIFLYFKPAQYKFEIIEEEENIEETDESE